MFHSRWKMFPHALSMPCYSDLIWRKIYDLIILRKSYIYWWNMTSDCAAIWYCLWVINLSLRTYAFPVIANECKICKTSKLSSVVKSEMRFVSGCLVFFFNQTFVKKYLMHQLTWKQIRQIVRLPTASEANLKNTTKYVKWIHRTTYWSRNKMAAILQTTFSNSFPCIKISYFDTHITENCSQWANNP